MKPAINCHWAGLKQINRPMQDYQAGQGYTLRPRLGRAERLLALQRHCDDVFDRFASHECLSIDVFKEIACEDCEFKP